MEQSFIVRIFQRNGEDPASLVGLVEEAGTGHQHPFRGAAQMVKILCTQEPPGDRSHPAGTDPEG